MKLSKIFEEKPERWGFRGDPYFWDYLKEIADKGYCTPATYNCHDEASILSDGTPSWSCSSLVHSWGIKKTAYATSKKEAKKNAAYLVLCERYHIPVK